MASPAVLHDLLRLFVSAGRRTPRGIDRVDLAYARFLCSAWPGPCFGLLPTPRGPRLFERGAVLRALDALERLWQEEGDTATDPGLARIRVRLAGHGVRPVVRKVARERLAPLRRLFAVRAEMGRGGHCAIANAPRGAVYVNVGQVGWAAPATTVWLLRRPDIHAVFMMHDAIPMERRDLVSRLGNWAYRGMLHSVARRCAGLIVTTESAAQSVSQALAARGQGALPTLQIPLPVAPLFLTPVAHDMALARRPYFLVCGALEPRKNLDMMLHVWRELALRRGELAPFLIIAGAPAWQGQQILRRLRAAGNAVVVAADLSSPALRQVMAHATAVLMPSLAEGFGLPIIEALTLGTPVVASDLPAHREAGGRFATYLDARDPKAWIAEIDALAQGGAALMEARQRVAAYRPFSQADYFHRASAFLTSLADAA